MLFSYTSLNYNHDVSKLHNYLENVVLNVWCTASGGFRITKLNKDFIPIVKHIKKNKNDYLYEPIKDIYNICKGLDQSQRDVLKDAFERNNNIEQLCNGSIQPVLYKDIEKIDPTQGAILAKQLKSFSENLYKHVIKQGKFCKQENTSLKKYYKDFLRVNTFGKCPFCGLVDIKPEDLPYIDAFDHYMPKAYYPFNTINILNLYPMCHECNSYCKGQKNPINTNKDKGTSRKAFYPISTSLPTISIKVKDVDIDPLDKLKSIVDVTLSTDDSYKDELKTWMDIFYTKVRYNSKLKHSSIDILEEARLYIKGPADFDKYISDLKSLNPYSDAHNFLRIPFLIKCHEEGII